MRNAETGQVDRYAAKVFTLKTKREEGAPFKFAVNLMLREFEVVKDLVHQNLVRLDYFLKVYDPMSGFPFVRAVLIMEECDGTLDEYIRKQGGHLTEGQASAVMRDVSSGLKCMHDNNRVHLDIKPDNVLYVEDKNKNKTFKLTDFGLGRRFRPGAPCWIKSRSGTDGYKAPEMDGVNYTNAKAADIFSLGMTMLEMLVKDANKEEYRIYLKEMGNMARKAQWPPVSNDADFLARRMTHPVWDKRPDINYVLAHRWVTPVQLPPFAPTFQPSGIGAQTVPAAAQGSPVPKKLIQMKTPVKAPVRTPRKTPRKTPAKTPAKTPEKTDWW